MKYRAVLHGDIVIKTNLDRSVAVKLLEAASAREDELKMTFFITNMLSDSDKWTLAAHYRPYSKDFRDNPDKYCIEVEI